MANKEKIDHLLSDVHKLERLIADMRDAEIYPVSFLNQTFDLTHKILKDLHLLESNQVEAFKKQMEEHQQLIQSIPVSKALPHPEPPPCVAEKTESLSDFRKAFSLNDRFYFRRELFAGDEAKMNKIISDLNDMTSYEESITYLNEKLNWNVENETVAGFIKLLEKRFA